MNDVLLSVKFTREQRAGIVALLLLMVLIQILFFLFLSFPETYDKPSKEAREWLVVQSEIDSLKNEKALAVNKVYPFNPNFISDYKGYTLKMTVAEIDRLHAYRKENKFVNSVEEFQQITKVSDVWLAEYAPYFKFPDWVKNKRKSYKSGKTSWSAEKKEKLIVVDINKATQEDLMKVYGIGPGLSERILKEREKFSAFVSMEQMKDVWGLSPEVIESLNRCFKVIATPVVKKIAINEASVRELQVFPYFRYPLAKEIVTFRSMNGEIKSKEDLIKIKNFPVEKVDIIALYLDF
ncbi:helix-hairpin-helix domain-containing protein [Flavobacterium enshiense]|uniref:ComEA family DNA-binding protein n=1 Tax=Flavobacterium enshiense TaxID=1341165 RepID=UPI00345D6645